MSKRQELADRRVDAFVAAVNASAKTRLWRDQVPEPCRLPDSDPDVCSWRIVTSSEAAWLAELEGLLPYAWSRTFRSLISRYVFPSFVCGPIEFYSVGVTDPLVYPLDLRVAAMLDRTMIPILWQAGYLPFAAPADGSYDPICFDCRNAPQADEPAVVWIDHEEILCHDRIRVQRQLAPAFHVLLEEMTAKLSAT